LVCFIKLYNNRQPAQMKDGGPGGESGAGKTYFDVFNR